MMGWRVGWVGRFPDYWVCRFPIVAVAAAVVAAVVEEAAVAAAVNTEADSESPAQPYSYNVPNSYRKIHSWNNSRCLWNIFHCQYRHRRRFQRLEEFLLVAAVVVIVGESLARVPLAG